MLLYDLQDSPLQFAHLTDTVEPLLNNQRVDFRAILLKFCNYLMDTDSRFLDKAVKINGGGACTFYTFFGLIPQRWKDTLANIVFYTLTINGNSHSD